MGSSYRILIVDDVPLLRTIAKNYFTRNEYQLTTARTVDETIRVATAIRPHLIIMDAEMPGQDGLTGCRLIKNHPVLFTTPVILVSRDDDESIEQCWQTGCDAVLPRPLNRRELLAVAQKLLTLANRAAPRVKQNILINYGRNENLEWHDYAINISNGGLYVATDNALKVGTKLQIEMIVPGAAGPTRCRGQVSWQNTQDNSLRPDLPTGIGIEFTEMDSAARKELRTFVLDSARHLPIARSRAKKPGRGEKGD